MQRKQQPGTEEDGQSPRRTYAPTGVKIDEDGGDGDRRRKELGCFVKRACF